MRFLTQQLLPAMAFSSLLTACSLAGAPPPDEPITLKVGEKVEVAEMTVTFSGVDSDNRCPVDVQCIVAGKATVVLLCELSDGKENQLQLNVPPGGDAKTSVGDYEITATVEPEAVSTRKIEAEDYVVTLVIDRGSGGA
jgi:hypothetical protein